MTVRVRFAPSPTGRLHVGNVFVALQNWLFAHCAGGRYLLRLDDTDRVRSTAAFADGIRDDLRWLGLVWGEEAAQSARTAYYAEAADRLRRAGRLYPCYETAEELALKRKAQLQSHQAPVYDRAALDLSASERAALEAAGRRPYWRFKLARQEMRWDDLVRGPQHIDEASQSDPVLVREDGTYPYTLPSVADDIALGVSHVIRGNDHVTNTGAQIQLFEALDAAVPRFGHLPLLVAASGEGLSKRTGALAVAELRERGIEPLALAAYLARLGTGDAPRPVKSLDELAAGHDLSRFGASSPRFDENELAQVNARLLHESTYAELAPRLAALGVTESLWNVVRGNVTTLADAARWRDICTDRIEVPREDPPLLDAAAELLPPEPWDDSVWSAWTSRVAERTGRKGRALYHPLRLALTGRGDGPELRHLLPLIGRVRAEARLRAGSG
jgi:glutamyl-tRNA synthetase